jgi:hypothetical protein
MTKVPDSLSGGQVSPRDVRKIVTVPAEVAEARHVFDPARQRNLRAHPFVTAEVDSGTLAAMATDAVGAERDALHRRFASQRPRLASYREMQPRGISMAAFTRQ